MIGDVNIFLHGSPPHLHSTDEDEFHAEAEIMIAGMFAGGQLLYRILSGMIQSVNIGAKDSRWKRFS